jgi:hypothetical protein
VSPSGTQVYFNAYGGLGPILARVHQSDYLGFRRAASDAGPRANDCPDPLLAARYTRESPDPHYRRWIPLADKNFLLWRVQAHG